MERINQIDESTKRINDIVANNPLIVQKVKKSLERLYYCLQNIEVDFDKQTIIERNKLEKRREKGCQDITKSPAFIKIQQKGWDKLNQKELRSIAQVISKKSGIILDREAKRRREILLKWFDENFESISPHMDRTTLEYEVFDI